MFHKICKKIVLHGISSGTIPNEQSNEYIYGMNMLFNVCVNIISMIIIGIITHRLWECVLFCLIYLELSSQMQRYIKINFKRRFPVQAFAWTLI